MVLDMETLKLIRKNLGYTCKYMSDLLKISKSYYWQIENKQRTLSYEMAVKIAKILKLKPDEIFYEEFKNLD